MSIEMPAVVAERLQKELVIWLTSVTPDGVPQPTPVWFLWENDEFLIFSVPSAKKVRNINTNKHVTLNLNSDFEGGQVAVITGTARLAEKPLHVTEVPTYLEKYREGIKNIGMTPESMAEAFSSAIYVTPTRVRTLE